MNTIASTTIRSSTDGVTKPSRPDSEEWLIDYRQRLQASIRQRKAPEGDVDALDRVAVIREK
jgi:hypothetical protein